MQIRDQYHDPAFSFLYNILQENPLAADFVKSASLDESKAATLPDTAFAWPEKRMFPIDTPENTIISQLYREKHAAIPVEVDTNLRKAIEIYNVQDILTQKKEGATTKQIAIKENEYLLPRNKRLRIKTAEDIKAAKDIKAAEKLLLEQYPRLNINDRAEGFVNLVKKAQELNVSLKPATYRMAGMTVCTTKMAQDFIEARRMATKEPLFQHAYEKLAAAFPPGEISDRDSLIEALNTLTHLDKAAGLESLYDKKLPDPIRTIFNTEKLAEETIDIAGRSISLSKLAAMPSTFWTDIIGPDMLREITDKTGSVDSTKLAQVVPTLPLELKLILKNQIP
ncbi:MAG: hypothetical protein PVI90_01155 [Desulfobacteraceae bacterium]|jgi:hypothetical protein